MPKLAGSVVVVLEDGTVIGIDAATGIDRSVSRVDITRQPSLSTLTWDEWLRESAEMQVGEGR